MFLIQYLLFWSFLIFSSVLQQYWYNKIIIVYPRLFLLNKILFLLNKILFIRLSRSLPFFYLFFLNNFIFPTLLLVNDNHLWFSICKIHYIIIIYTFSLKTSQIKRSWSRLAEFGRYITADIYIMFYNRLFNNFIKQLLCEILTR